MIAAVSKPRPRGRVPDPRQRGLPFRADPPPPAIDGPEQIGRIVLRVLAGGTRRLPPLDPLR